jgi:basic amino acid/polyamine antiporter, APA family
MPSQLPRELTLTSATALVVSNMIGVGVFGAAGFLIGDLGRPPLVLGVWLAGAVVAMAGCLSYAELGINLPRSGGEYVYVREAWGPMWGFLSGWISFFAGFSAPIAAGALLFSEYLGHFFPALSTSTAEIHAHWTARFFHWGGAQWTALAVIGMFALINILGVALAAKVQNWLTGIKVAVLGIFIILAFSAGNGHWENFTQSAARTSSHSLAAQFAISLVFVMYAYSGWNAATYVAEEIQQPGRTLPRALVFGTGIVAVIYLGLNAAFLYALPPDSLQGVVRVGATAATALFGRGVGGLFSGIMAAAILSSVSAMVIVGPRVYYAMAEDGCFFADAARIHPRWRTPSRAVVYQAAASAAMVVTASFAGLAYYIGVTLIFFAALATAGLIRMRRRAGWKHLPALDAAFPLIPGVFILASLWMVVYMVWLRPVVSVWSLVTLVLGMLVYGWRFRGRARESSRPGTTAN